MSRPFRIEDVPPDWVQQGIGVEAGPGQWAKVPPPLRVSETINVVCPECFPPWRPLAELQAWPPITQVPLVRHLIACPPSRLYYVWFGGCDAFHLLWTSCEAPSPGFKSALDGLNVPAILDLVSPPGIADVFKVPDHTTIADDDGRRQQAREMRRPDPAAFARQYAAAWNDLAPEPFDPAEVDPDD